MPKVWAKSPLGDWPRDLAEVEPGALAWGLGRSRRGQLELVYCLLVKLSFEPFLFVSGLESEFELGFGKTKDKFNLRVGCLGQSRLMTTALYMFNNKD